MKFFVITVIGVLLLIGSATLYGFIAEQQRENRCQPAGDFITVDGIRLHFLERAGGEFPVIFLHGASANALDWQNSIFSSLPKHFYPIALDRPGLGHSEPSAEDDFQDQLQLIHAAIEKMRLSNPVIVAHSLSGVIGARLLTDYPDKYRGLVVVSGATYPIGDGSSWYTILADIPVIGWLFRHAVIPVAAPVIAPGFIQNSFHPQPVADNYREQTCLDLLFSPRRFLTNSRHLNQIRQYLDQSYPLYAKIRQPVSLIYGDEDQVIYQFSHSAGFRYKVPHARVIMLPQTGHLPQYSHGDIIVAELERVIRETSTEKQ